MSLLVEKQSFTLPSFTTLGGRTLREVKAGFECFGRLNEAGDNAVLVPHHFSGTSHIAGKYSEQDAEPGYWDAIIGPGKAIDTDRYFVIGVDCLSNLNAHDPRMLSTGPASLDPDTGKPYGLNFPVVTIRDFVEVQHALLTSLGVSRLQAVAGVSMGSMQAMEWSVAYPQMVQRVVAVTPHGTAASAYLNAMINTWMSFIRLDPNWRGGDYYDHQPPLEGLAAAVKTVLLAARHYDWAETIFGRRWSSPEHDPLASLENGYFIETAFDQIARARAAQMDANAFLYLCRANQLYQLGHSGDPVEAIRALQAKVLVMPVASDLMLFPDYARSLAASLQAADKQVEYWELSGGNGHLDGVLAIDRLAERIQAFLER
jgi:homoserine O-acetyltransferase